MIESERLRWLILVVVLVSLLSFLLGEQDGKEKADHYWQQKIEGAMHDL